jgi:hypothetical protein
MKKNKKTNELSLLNEEKQEKHQTGQRTPNKPSFHH